MLVAGRRPGAATRESSLGTERAFQSSERLASRKAGDDGALREFVALFDEDEKERWLIQGLTKDFAEEQFYSITELHARQRDVLRNFLCGFWIRKAMQTRRSRSQIKMSVTIIGLHRRTQKRKSWVKAVGACAEVKLEEKIAVRPVYME